MPKIHRDYKADPDTPFFEPQSNSDQHTGFGAYGGLEKNYYKKITHSALPLAASLELLYYNTVQEAHYEIN